MSEEKKVDSTALAVAHIENKYQSGELLWTRSNKDKVKVSDMNDYHLYHSRAILLKKPEHPIVDKWVEIFTRELNARKQLPGNEFHEPKKQPKKNDNE